MTEHFKKIQCHLLCAFCTGSMVACIAQLYWINSIHKFHSDIRGYIFSGLLTLGSFLLTTKTFVITRLQEGLFQSKEYSKDHNDAVEKYGNAFTGDRNQHLQNLSEFLAWSVAACLSTAILQLIISQTESNELSIIALSCVCGSFTLVLKSWWHLRRLIQKYLTLANKSPVK
jgi:hypothetical protein